MSSIEDWRMQLRAFLPSIVDYTYWRFCIAEQNNTLQAHLPDFNAQFET
jgi:hypothetical protein